MKDLALLSSLGLFLTASGWITSYMKICSTHIG